MSSNDSRSYTASPYQLEKQATTCPEQSPACSAPAQLTRRTQYPYRMLFARTAQQHRTRWTQNQAAGAESEMPSVKHRVHRASVLVALLSRLCLLWLRCLVWEVMNQRDRLIWLFMGLVLGEVRLSCSGVHLLQMRDLFNVVLEGSEVVGLGDLCYGSWRMI